MSNFLFLHPGARAHYLLPRALAKIGRLKVLITDTWISPKKLDQLFFLPSNIREKLKGRYHEDLQSVELVDLGWKGLWFEYRLRKKYPNYGWLQVVARDNYVKQATLKLLHSRLKKNDTLIGFAYTSLEAFKAAKKIGVKTILYQMDPAKAEEDYIAEVIQQGRYVTKWEKAPAVYWEQWSEECDLADTILVNSEWSKQGLIKQGVLADKIKIFPLPIEIRISHQQFIRTYPEQFNKDRPLRLLFLGTLMIRKGIHIVLEAAQQLEGLPVEFILVGRSEIEPQIYAHLSNVRYEGEVPRAQVDDYYKEADIFLFPTLSDGFGLTQLEAMAWKLPVINTLHCAQVLSEEAGWTLPPDSHEKLVNVIQNVLEDPHQLKIKSSFAFKQADSYNINTFATSFITLL